MKKKNYKKQLKKVNKMKTPKVFTQVQPQPIRKIFCPTRGCGELMVKVYPWASFNIVGEIKPCYRCLNKTLSK